MDASTTIEIQLDNPDHNFFIKKQYTYGEITICFLLIVILALQFWQFLLKMIENLRKKN